MCLQHTFVLFQILGFVCESRLARYVMTSLLTLASNLILLDLVNGIFVANAMEVAMKMLETGKSKMFEVLESGESEKSKTIHAGNSDMTETSRSEKSEISETVKSGNLEVLETTNETSRSENSEMTETEKSENSERSETGRSKNSETESDVSRKSLRDLIKDFNELFSVKII